MNLQAIKKAKKKSIVSVRIPSEIREKAQALVHSQSADGGRVTESDVYREIIVSYFSEDRLQNLYES